MFVDVSIVIDRDRQAIALPASAISYAPYGNSVFVVTTMKDPRGQDLPRRAPEFVKLGDATATRSRSSPASSPARKSCSSGVFKLRNGAAVLVNNATRPSNDRAPKPEDS
mgnify:CR=1 FL=1